ncbi:MAG: hypothetical protein SNJ74_05265 [Fimbriimonadaceae bacterium]
MTKWWKMAATVCVGALVASAMSQSILTFGARTGLDGRVSRSKLSVHLLGGSYTPGAQAVLRAGPPVIKVLHPHRSYIAAIRDYKVRYPRGVVVMRIYTDRRWTLQDDPVVAANEFWNEVLWPPLSQMSEADRRLITYLEGPNESHEVPTWDSPTHAYWFGQFWVRLIQHMTQHGFKPNIGSIAVGNPPGTPSEIQTLLANFGPALDATLAVGGTWGYHAYTIQYTQDPGIEYWFALRYRMIRQAMINVRPVWGNIKVILTEGGVDDVGDPQNSGWQARGTQEKFKNWLKWFDQEMQLDPYVIGCTLFQIGDPWWSSFDVEPIAPWLADYIRSKR